MRVPDADRSMLRHADRPIPLTPFIESERALDRRSTEVAFEIAQLSEILNRSRERRRRDD